MKIIGFDIYRYRLSMNRPLMLRGQTLMSREGLLIRLTDDSDYVGWGEIAPLPGFNIESLADATVAVRQLRFGFKQSEIPEHLEELSGGFAHWLKEYPLPSSVQFGFESAVLTMQAQAKGQTLAPLLSHSAATRVEVNGLISSDLSGIDSEIVRVEAAGYRAVKIKVGRGSVEEDVELVKRVGARLGHECEIRLDANRSWEMTEAIAFARGIESIPIDYLEEPLRDPHQLATFAEKSGLRIALDETLRECTPETVPHLTIARAAIIRPGQLGGLERAMQFARRAGAHGLTPVVSSNIESAVGIATVAAFAAVVTPPNTPVGLDTRSWFAKQPIERPLSDSKATIDIETAERRAREIDFSNLEDITND